MAMICKKCGGLIPDFMLSDNKSINDCKNHMKRQPDIKIQHW